MHVVTLVPITQVYVQTKFNDHFPFQHSVLKSMVLEVQGTYKFITHTLATTMDISSLHEVVVWSAMWNMLSGLPWMLWQWCCRCI